jgi:CRP-like cAMP-binding protein
MEKTMGQGRTVMSNASAHADLLGRSLERFGPLAPEEKGALPEAVRLAEQYPSGTELIAEREPADRPAILLSGWAAHLRSLPDGRRQIFEFLVPGDVYGLSLRPNARALASTVALTPVVVTSPAVLATALATDLDAPDTIANFALKMIEREESYLLDHIVRIGRQTAYERVVHLFLELFHRLDEVGLASNMRFPLPLTQEILADALGLSIVHVNRTLQQLRRDRMIEVKDSVVTLVEPTLLAGYADFKPRMASHGHHAHVV